MKTEFININSVYRICARKLFSVNSVLVYVVSVSVNSVLVFGFGLLCPPLIVDALRCREASSRAQLLELIRKHHYITARSL
jgi:hypothetical protein